MSRWLFVFATLAACAPAAPGSVTVSAPATASVSPPPPHVAADAAPCHASRACLARAAATEPCDGSSPSLARLELAVDLVDGTHGAADIARGRKELATCFDDVAVQAVREHADAKERDATTPPFASCDDFALTTVATTECLAEHQTDEDAWLRARAVPMDAETSRLFAAANAAFGAYAERTGEIAYAMYAGGTLRDPAMRSAILQMTRRRHAALVAASFTTVDAGAEQAAARDWASARTGATDAMRDPLDAAERAWPAYRDAELAYFLRVNGGSRAAILTALARAHGLDIRAVVSP